jgi:predicted PurR-regulated permease PerM
MKTMTVRGSPILRYMLAAAAIVIVVFGLKYSSDVLAPIFFAATLAILGVFLSFLFWSWVFGFVGALLAIPATLFVKTLLQGRQETRFLVVLLSGQGDSDATVTIPADKQDEINTVEEDNDSSDTSRATLIVDSTDSPVHEE